MSRIEIVAFKLNAHHCPEESSMYYHAQAIAIGPRSVQLSIWPDGEQGAAIVRSRNAVSLGPAHETISGLSMHIRAAVPHCEVRDVVAGGYYIESPGDGDYMLFVAELGVGETVRLQVLDERDKNIGSITYELVEIIVAPVLAARLKRTVDARPFPKFEELKKEVEDEGERALQEKLRTGNHHPQEDVIVESRRETNR